MPQYLDSNGLNVLFRELYKKITELFEVTQLKTLPTVTAETFPNYTGKIFQYTGETTDTQVRGRFYECVQTPSGYEWQEVNITVYPDSTQIKLNADSRDGETVYNKIFDIERSVSSLESQQGVQDVVEEKNYLRTKGAWVEFTKVDGSAVEVTVKLMNSADTYTPKQGEFVYLTDRDMLVFGDGTKTLAQLTDIRGGSLTYTPENSAYKGAPNGYAPLDELGKVPNSYLPTLESTGYTKEETDTKIKEGDDKVALDLNTEITNRKAADASVQGNLDQHIADTVLHISAAERDKWNAKVDTADLTKINDHIADTTIHVTAADKNRWDGRVSAYIVNDQTELNAIPTDQLSLGSVAYLKTGTTADGAVQADKYIWYGTEQGGWSKEDAGGSVVSVEWSGIKNGPNATIIQLEYAANTAHSHNNKLQLDQISENNAGALMYRGVPIGANILYFDADTQLPITGREDTLYIIMKDSGAFNQPTLRVYSEGKYVILGRVFQNQSAQQTNTRILQENITITTANTTYNITLPKDSEFKFMPFELLKRGGDTGKRQENFVNMARLEYKPHMFQISNNKLRVGDKLWFAERYAIDDAVYYTVDTDISELKDVIQII